MAKESSRAAQLLAQVLAHPDDVEPRLVYADLLSEQGDPRGAFIAQQCALAELATTDKRYAPTLAATQRLRAAHARAWCELPVTDDDDKDDEADGKVDAARNATFVRGMLQRIAMEPGAFLAEWARLRKREPLDGVELIVHEGIWENERGIVAPPELRELKISTTGWFTAYSVAQILCWGMPQLRALDISGCDIGMAGAQILSNMDTDLGEHADDYQKPPLFEDGALEELRVAGSQIYDEGAVRLFGARHLANLRTLDLARTRISSAETLQSLRHAPAMKKLRRLGLAGNAPIGEHLGALAGWEALAHLEALTLPKSATPEALTALFPAPSRSLRELALVGGKELARWPGLEELTKSFVELDLGMTSLGDERWAALLAAPSLRTIVHLHANNCSLSDKAIDKLVASKLDRLVTLDVASNKLTDRAMAALAAWPGLQHVTHLRVHNNRKVTAAGFASLIASPHLQPIELEVGKLADEPTLAKLRERFGAAVIAR